MTAARYLLDTHSLIWWWLGEPALSRTAREIMQAESSLIYVSAVTGIEIALKVRAKKLPAMAEPLARFDELIVSDSFSHLPIAYTHSIRAGLLDGDHHDPFDRLLAAQALIENLTVITRDPQIAAFGCAVAW